jgi:hypothetical protein
MGSNKKPQKNHKGSSAKLADIPEPKSTTPNSSRIQHGRLIPPQQQILLLSHDEWEAFIEEWAHHQKTRYLRVLRMSGPSDQGIDIAGLTDKDGLFGVWDNYQCKHYKEALSPPTAIVEIGKILWHSFKGEYKPPRKYYFVAPKGCGMKLTRLLADPANLKKSVIEDWDKYCSNAITSKETITLDGAFKDYTNNFDFSIFTQKIALDIIDDHKMTPYHAARFGGGLPDRPKPIAPPPTIEEPLESRYIQQLLSAYSDHLNTLINALENLSEWPALKEEFNRQREHFYHAESLRNFARDTVPPGTFEELQKEIYAGVIDIINGQHADGRAKMQQVLQAAMRLQMTANALISVVKMQDRMGICHQLANEDKLQWTDNDKK